MEICFSAATQWPMNLALQFVVDGAPRNSPVDVTVGRSICKSQVSGSRQVIYYVRNPPLLRMARSFDARTVGYRLAGPTTLEWHLSTAPALPTAAAAPKAQGRRKAGGGKGAGGSSRASSHGPEDWQGPQQHAFAGAGPADGGAHHRQQQPQQQLASAPPALLAQIGQWLQLQPSQGSPDAGLRTKRRKQDRPIRAPFYGFHSGSPGVCCFEPCGKRQRTGAVAAA
jgi:hypothetical protein